MLREGSSVVSVERVSKLSPLYPEDAPGTTRSPPCPLGFRSSFRDWTVEETDHPREVIESALAHVIQNKVEAAYARSDLFERRRLMDDWAGVSGRCRTQRTTRNTADPPGAFAIQRSLAVRPKDSPRRRSNHPPG